MPSPPSRGPGVRRLNRLPIVFGVGAAMLVVAAIGYTYRDRLMQSVANAQQAASHKPEPANGAAVLSNAPIAGEVQPAVANKRLPPRQRDAADAFDQQSLATPSDGGGSPAQDEDDATQGPARGVADLLSAARAASEGAPDGRHVGDDSRHRPESKARRPAARHG